MYMQIHRVIKFCMMSVVYYAISFLLINFLYFGVLKLTIPAVSFTYSGIATPCYAHTIYPGYTEFATFFMHWGLILILFTLSAVGYIILKRTTNSATRYFGLILFNVSALWSFALLAQYAFLYFFNRPQFHLVISGLSIPLGIGFTLMVFLSCYTLFTTMKKYVSKKASC